MSEIQIPSAELSLDIPTPLQWLSHVGNDERKLLILLAMDYGTDQYYTGTTVLRELSDLAEVDVPSDRESVRSFMSKSLSKVDGVVPVKVGPPGRQTTVFELGSNGKTFGVPFAGALLKWS